MGYCVLHDNHFPKTCIHCAVRPFQSASAQAEAEAAEQRNRYAAVTADQQAKFDDLKAKKPALPTDSAERKRWPLFSGLLRYFPAALARVSHHSFVGNEKHNPGQKLNHARGKSGDHEDCIVRHLVDASEHPAGSSQRLEELSALAWRALALLQEECELAGHRPAPGATFDKEPNAIR